MFIDKFSVFLSYLVIYFFGLILLFLIMFLILFGICLNCFLNLFLLFLFVEGVMFSYLIYFVGIFWLIVEY